MFYQLHPIAQSEYLKKERSHDRHYPPHLHASFEVVSVLEGSMSVTVDGREHLLHSGDALLVFPNQVHSFCSHGSEDVLFIFSPKLIAAFAAKHAGMLPQSNRFSLPDDLRARLTALEEDSSTIEMKGVLYLVCAELEKTAQYRSAQSGRDNLLLRIFDFVDRQYKTDCTLRALSRSVGYDSAYLSRYFKKSTGLPYNAYVNAYRLNQAGYLLRNGEASVLWCSIECGYTSLRTFNRNFKDYYGQTPLEYKRACGK